MLPPLVNAPDGKKASGDSFWLYRPVAEKNEGVIRKGEMTPLGKHFLDGV